MNLLEIVSLAKRAGEAILAAERKSAAAKADGSPLTEADIASEAAIMAGLQIYEIPVLSEEAESPSFDLRKNWCRCWLVDPLDGTREFVAGSSEFTVNIALIEDGAPVLGVVHAPRLGKTYYAAQGQGAFREDANGVARIRVAEPAAPLRVVASRSHRGDRLDAWLEKLPAHALLSIGSSLKFCLVAEGAAHLYPRLGRTMEWDTAAAQCIVEEAGGVVVDLDGKRLLYNKADLSNPDFLAQGTADLLLRGRDEDFAG